MFMSDIGDDWQQLDGTLDTAWRQALVKELATVPSSEFETFDESRLMVNPDGRDCTCYCGTAKKR
jgi:hypothetical protein